MSITKQILIATGIILGYLSVWASITIICLALSAALGIPAKDKPKQQHENTTKALSH